MGVLVGTSLIVIIPEGVDTLYSANVPSTRSHISGRQVDNAKWQVSLPAATTADMKKPLHVFNPVSPPSPSASDLIASAVDDHLRSEINLHPRKDDAKGQGEKDSRNNDEGSAHAWIGIALISGFVLMYLVDMLPEFILFPKQQRPLYHVSLDNLGSGLRRIPSPSRESGLLDVGNRSHSFATTIGLVIHAAADGIALGASSSDAGLGFIIFLAIMVHKAPASFGLTSVLLKQGLSSRSVRAHLLAFSLAAPVGALTTFLFVQIAGSGLSGDEQGTRWRTGMLLLFSAGTFL